MNLISDNQSHNFLIIFEILSLKRNSKTFRVISNCFKMIFVVIETFKHNKKFSA